MVAGVRLRRSRLTFCVLVLVLNAALHVVFLLTSSSLLPSPAESWLRSRNCALPCSHPTPLSGPAPSGLPASRAVDVRDAEKKEEGHYLLVVLVLSSVDSTGRKRRDSIRATWAAGLRERVPPVLVRFALGTLGLAPTQRAALHTEGADQGDLLLLPALEDSYYNLTRKVLQAMVELDHGFSFSYLLKCDDDSFVVLEPVCRELAGRDARHSLYWGFFDGRATPKRGGKWVESGWFLCDHYLPYALGGGYVLSSDLVHRIALNADGLQMYVSEDVSVGVWLGAFQAERKHDTRFNTEFVSRGCQNSYLVSHKQSIEDMESKQRLLEARGVQCDKQFQTRASYEYDWSSPPSQCCQRLRGIP